MLLDPETLDLAPHAAEAWPRSATRASRSRCRRRSWRSSRRRTPPWPTRPPSLPTRRRDAARRASASAGAGAHPFASGLGPLNPGAALRGDRRRVRVGGEPPARLRPAHPRRDPGRRPRARRLQRAAFPPARPRRAGRQRAVLRGPATADWRPSARGSAACCRARGSRPRSRASTRTRTPCAGAASTTRASGGGSCACTRSSGRSRSACRTRRRRSPTRPPWRPWSYELATRLEPAPPAESWGARPEPLGRLPPRARRGDDGPHTGERATARERLTRVLGAAPPELDGARRQRDIAAERGLRGLVETLAEAFVSPARGPG